LSVINIFKKMKLDNTMEIRVFLVFLSVLSGFIFTTQALRALSFTKGFLSVSEYSACHGFIF